MHVKKIYIPDSLGGMVRISQLSHTEHYIEEIAKHQGKIH